MQRSFKVVNVVATMNCGFSINMERLWASENVLYAAGERGPVYTGVRPPKATKQITVFHNGNMITVGNKSVKEARQNLGIAKVWLRGFERTPKPEEDVF